MTVLAEPVREDAGFAEFEPVREEADLAKLEPAPVEVVSAEREQAEVVLEELERGGSAACAVCARDEVPLVAPQRAGGCLADPERAELALGAI